MTPWITLRVEGDRAAEAFRQLARVMRRFHPSRFARPLRRAVSARGRKRRVLAMMRGAA